MLNLVLFGPPGVGKGTQSEKILQQYPFSPIAPGHLFRAQMHQGTALTTKIASYINAGKLVPDALVITLIEEQIKTKSPGIGFLFDGFPRTVVQSKSLDERLRLYKRQVDGVIFLEAPVEILKQRIKSRAKEAGRIDDQEEEKIATRMDLYFRETLPVAAYYEQQKKLFKINAMGTIEAIFERIVAVIDALQTAPKEYGLC